MKILFLIAFGGGLAFAVYSMLHGVERHRAAGLTLPAPYLNLPAVAAFMTAFGAVGYLLVRNSNLSALPTGLIALASGAGGWLGMSVLMAKWALRPATANAHNEADEVQGQLAVVVNPIHGNVPGSIRYDRNGSKHEAPALSIDHSELPHGAEVVIDRFEDGVAIVEDWAAVEQRL